MTGVRQCVKFDAPVKDGVFWDFEKERPSFKFQLQNGRKLFHAPADIHFDIASGSKANLCRGQVVKRGWLLNRWTF
jgi:hypothetical protein